MTDVIIIGFDYFRGNENTLLGTLSDMRYAYDHIKNLNTNKVSIITDILESDNNKKNITDPNELFFINNIQNYDEYHLFIGKLDMLNHIQKIVKKSKRLFVYYSGHALEQKILLPNNTKESEISYVQDSVTEITNISEITNIPEITDNEESKDKNNEGNELSFVELKNIIVKNVKKDAQILFMSDCCSGCDMGLPLMMNSENGIYYLKGEKFLFPTQEIVCISASLKDQSSFSDVGGSIFTKEFFTQLRKMVEKKDQISFLKLINQVGFMKLNNYSQTLNIHSSRPNLKIMWHWFFSKSYINIRFKRGCVILDY